MPATAPLYFCYSEPAATGRANSTALARATLSADSARLENLRVIFSQKPKVASTAHFGCRIVESRAPGANGQPDGKLFLTLGERFSRKEDAQKLDNHHGKIVRINKDGSVPPDNPFVGKAGALPEIWSYGHRNAQGATLAPDGTFWMHEHGPQGGDEINLPKPGANYGWPVITYGENYGGGKIGEGLSRKAGMEQPLHYWVPSIAPSGMAFLTSERYGKAWQGNLFVGSLKFSYLDRIELSAAFRRQGGAGEQAADRGRRAHPRCPARPGRPALCADRQHRWQAHPAAARSGRQISASEQGVCQQTPVTPASALAAPNRRAVIMQA